MAAGTGEERTGVLVDAHPVDIPQVDRLVAAGDRRRVGELDRLGVAGGARGEDPVGDIVLGQHGLLRRLVVVRERRRERFAAVGRVAADQQRRLAAVRQPRPHHLDERGLDDDRRRARELKYVGEFPADVQGVDRHRDRAEPVGGVVGQVGLDRAGVAQHDDDAVTPLHTASAQYTGQRERLLRQFGIGETHLLATGQQA